MPPDVKRPIEPLGRAPSGLPNSVRTLRPTASIGALLPFLLVVLVLGAYPLLQVARMAFSSASLVGTQFTWTWNGLQNFGSVLHEPAAIQAAQNTVVFVVFTATCTVALGLVLALIVDRAVTTLPLARNILIWPAIITPVIVSLMWLLILSPTAGGLNKALLAVGLPGQRWLDSPTGAMVSIIVVDVWHWTPVAFLFLYAALKGIDESFMEAARVDGASELQVIRHVVIPYLAPALGAVLLLRVVMGVKAFDEMYLVTGGGPAGATTLVSQYIKDLFFTSLRFGEAAAYGLAVLVAIAGILGALLVARQWRHRR